MRNRKPKPPINVRAPRREPECPRYVLWTANLGTGQPKAQIMCGAYPIATPRRLLTLCASAQKDITYMLEDLETDTVLENTMALPELVQVKTEEKERRANLVERFKKANGEHVLWVAYQRERAREMAAAMNQ